MGELAGVSSTSGSFVAPLMRLLDDAHPEVIRSALASLPQVVGRDVAESADGTPVGTAEQVRRWKQWRKQEERAAGESPRR